MQFSFNVQFAVRLDGGIISRIGQQVKRIVAAQNVWANCSPSAFPYICPSFVRYRTRAISFRLTAAAKNAILKLTKFG
jgi:hypothetical protein